MKMQSLKLAAPLLLLAGMCIYASTTFAQQASLTQNKGVTSKPLGTIDLGAEIEGMAGRQLRARAVTVEPGGVVATHSHKDRPCMEYIVQGKITEYRNGQAIEHVAGDMVLADKNTVHGWENKGADTVLLLPVDIIKP